MNKHACDPTSSVLTQCICTELFKLNTMGFKKNISSAHQFWQQLNVNFMLLLHMPPRLYLQIIIYKTLNIFVQLFKFPVSFQVCLITSVIHSIIYIVFSPAFSISSLKHL